MGLVASWHVGSSRTRDQTHVSYIGRWILYHRATRKSHVVVFFFFNKWMKLWASCWLWARSCAIQYVSMFVTTIFYMGKWVGVCMYKWNECILDVSEFVIMCVFLSTQLWQYELSTATSCVWIVSHQVWRHVYMCEYICWYVLICKLVTQSCSTLWFHGL